jgi:hypothetical protein
LGSLTVAVTSVVDEPLATSEGGERDTVTVAAGLDVWVRVAWPLTPGAEASVAVTVDCPALVVLVIVAV